MLAHKTVRRKLASANLALLPLDQLVVLGFDALSFGLGWRFAARALPHEGEQVFIRRLLAVFASLLFLELLHAVIVELCRAWISLHVPFEETFWQRFCRVSKYGAAYLTPALFGFHCHQPTFWQDLVRVRQRIF